MLIKIIVILTAFAFGVGSLYYGPFKNKHDNPVEELSEEIIEQEIGYGIDLTPSSPEKDDHANK